MLSCIFAKNFALIESVSMEISGGFSVLTGETGAGKSLILDSMALFLSQKPPREMIREGEDELSVSLSFSDISPEKQREISEITGISDTDFALLLSRSVSREGKSVCRINGRVFPFGVVKEIAGMLFAIRGQHDAVGLTDPATHLSYLDSALGEAGGAAKETYRAAYEKYTAQKDEISALESAPHGEDYLGMLEYRIKEIEKIKPKVGEEAMLLKKRDELRAKEKTARAVGTAHKALSGGEKGRGAVYLVRAASESLGKLAENEKYSELSAKLAELADEISAASEKVSAFAFEDCSDEDGVLSEKIDHRLDQIYRITAKYGPTESDVINALEEAKRQKDELSEREDRIKELKKALAEDEKALLSAGAELTKARTASARALEESIVGVLRFLDMPKTLFRVSITPAPKPLSTGLDTVEFFISPNTGEGSKPLSQIASGGELSRIMLAIQIKFGKAKDADTLVFDEIDTGISGSTSQKIGICLKKLGEKKQVLCVTHSAQVATLADSHFKVEKTETGERTKTGVSLLDSDGRIEETARILGGAGDASAARLNAAELRREGQLQFDSVKEEL